MSFSWLNSSSSSISFSPSSSLLSVLATRHIFGDVSPRHAVFSTSHASLRRFLSFLQRHRRLASRVINCQLLKLVSGYVFTSLAVKLAPLHPAVIFTPPQPAVNLRPSCWPSNSPLSAKRSSSTPAGGRIHPPPPSGHLPCPCWRSNVPIPA